MKELRFATERPKGPDGRDTAELPINGEMYEAYRPSTNSLAFFYAAIGRRSLAAGLNGVIDFLQKNVEPAAFAIIMRGVDSDALELEDLIGLCNEIIEEFAENPTGSSADSSKSRASTGARSTASSRRPASTRASSPSRGS